MLEERAKGKQGSEGGCALLAELAGGHHLI